MLTPGELADAFRIYRDEMERCRRSGTFWALLHVTVCLPDICAALQSADGEATGRLFAEWCDRYLPDPLLTGSERWLMRCKVLHQGRAHIGPHGRYIGFAYTQPAATGHTYHKQIEKHAHGTTLVLDVGLLSREVESGVERWIADLAAHPRRAEALNAKRNLPSLVRVRQFALPQPPGSPQSFVRHTIDRSS